MAYPSSWTPGAELTDSQRASVRSMLPRRNTFEAIAARGRVDRRVPDAKTLTDFQWLLTGFFRYTDWWGWERYAP